MTSAGSRDLDGVLEHALAAVGELELRRAGGGELDELVVEERHPGLQAPGHRHVVDPLDRVVDEHDLGVEAQRRVDRGVGARRGEVRGDEVAAARRSSTQYSGAQIDISLAVVAVEEDLRGRRRCTRSRGTSASGGYQS